jgi:hypothetical protein
VSDLCRQCGKLHDGACDRPVTEPPPGLFDADGELTRLGALVEDAANYLAMRGYLDPDAEEWPDWVLAELVDVYQAGPCPTCHEPLNGSDLADHFLALKQDEYERSLPTWGRDCGAVYKILLVFGIHEHFFAVRDDGLLGDEVGVITRKSKGEVSRSDACPACGRRFADTIADRADPQQALFDRCASAATARPVRQRGGPHAAPGGPATKALDQADLFGGMP